MFVFVLIRIIINRKQLIKNIMLAEKTAVYTGKKNNRSLLGMQRAKVKLPQYFIL